MFAAHTIGCSAREGRLEQAMEFVCGDKEQTSLELNMSHCKQSKQQSYSMQMLGICRADSNLMLRTIVVTC